MQLQNEIIKILSQYNNYFEKKKFSNSKSFSEQLFSNSKSKNQNTVAQDNTFNAPTKTVKLNLTDPNNKSDYSKYIDFVTKDR